MGSILLFVCSLLLLNLRGLTKPFHLGKLKFANSSKDFLLNLRNWTCKEPRADVNLYLPVVRMKIVPLLVLIGMAMAAYFVCPTLVGWYIYYTFSFFMLRYFVNTFNSRRSENQLLPSESLVAADLVRLVLRENSQVI